MLETVNYKLKSFFDWLEKEATGCKVVKILLAAFLINLAYSYSARCIIEYLLFNIPGHTAVSGQPISGESISIISLGMVGYFVIGAVLEEYFFRLAPLFLVFAGAMITTGSLDNSVKSAFFSAIPISILFGYLHGGYENIFIQGVSGMIYSIVYLKLGGAQERFIRGWFYSSVVHFSYNMTIVLIGAIFYVRQYFTYTP